MYLLHGLFVGVKRSPIEENEDYLLQARGLLKVTNNGAQRYGCGQRDRIAIDTGADRWEGNAFDLVLFGQIETGLIRVGEQLLLIAALLISGADRVEDIL